MRLSGRRIRKAFEHMTPNVLNTVLPDDCPKKGVVIPMSEKKTMLPPVIKKIAAAAAMIALLFGIGSVGLMILNRGTHQFSDNPTEPSVENITGRPVFETENITRISFSGFYGSGRKIDVPEENIAEIIAYLETFTFGEIAVGTVPPGTDTIHIEIEYADGSVIYHGMNTVTVNGLTYYIQGGTAPECYDNIIADAVLEDQSTEPPTEPPTEGPTDPLEMLKTKARAYMLENTYNGDKYALYSFEQYGTWDYYIADFRYMLNGIPTEDSCWVSIWFDGSIRSISKFHTGKFLYVDVTDEMIRRTEEKLYSDYSLPKDTTQILSREFTMGITDLHMKFTVLKDSSSEPTVCYVAVLMSASNREYPDKNSIPIPDGPISEETAVYYLSHYVDDTTGYILREFSYSPDGLYTAIFHHQLGGLYTGDMCTVIMRENKSLYNCIVSGQVMYDDVHFTEDDMAVTTENVYALYGLSKEEWSCTPKMVEWYFGRLSIGFDVRKNDGTDVRYFNMFIPYKKNIATPEDAVFWAAEYFGKEELSYTVTNCELDENGEIPHYDVSFMVGVNEAGGTVVYEYTCEVGVPYGQLRIISIKPV